MIVEVDGKVRDKLEVERGLDLEKARKLAENSQKVQKYIEGKKYRVIYLPDKLVNFVTV